MKPKHTIEEMKKLAKKNGGKCLSNKYVNVDKKLLWQCKNKHLWWAKPKNVLAGYWCAKCGYEGRKLSIKDMQEVALKKKGKCLSKEYKGSSFKLKWQCEKGHVWEARPNDVKQGTWCSLCARRELAGKRKLSISEMKKLAEKRGGTCLSTKYANAKKKLRWRCEKGHVFEATPTSIKYKGTWCPYCAGYYQTIKDMRKWAAKKRGKCLSEKYINNYIKLRWMCSEGHIWEAAPFQVKSGQWCPICSTGVSERICRKYFEKIFNCKFQKVRPSWCLSSKQKKMELDGYNKVLKLAFEYQGRQHYEHIGHFHRERTINQQKKDDLLKGRACRKFGVTLIEVPYYIEYEVLDKFIISECKKAGVAVPKQISKIGYESFNVYSPRYLDQLAELARKRGGRCLSKKYINNTTKLKWQCKYKHTWLATPHSIKRGCWCPYCSGRRQNIKDMQQLAKKMGGKCLSKRYLGTAVKLKWLCKQGHIWEARPAHIKKGTWCPYCAGRKS